MTRRLLSPYLLKLQSWIIFLWAEHLTPSHGTESGWEHLVLRISYFPCPAVLKSRISPDASFPRQCLFPDSWAPSQRVGLEHSISHFSKSICFKQWWAENTDVKIVPLIPAPCLLWLPAGWLQVSRRKTGILGMACRAQSRIKVTVAWPDLD